MSAIVLATLNARYTHTAFGLRYLLANMGELQSETRLMEFVIHDDLADVLAAVLSENPVIVGFGVYIWNVEPLTRLTALLKRVRPEVIIVVGGPEVSYESAEQQIVQLADYLITGEADLAFADLCRTLLAGRSAAHRILSAPLPQMQELRLPYEFYSDEDIAQRVIYVEVSRGCPFTCEFCLSALEIPVRMADPAIFLAAMGRLLERGARQFKFVDRTFNLNLRVSRMILQFFLDNLQPGLFLHFEMIPDRLPESLRELIVLFPAGSLQFEIGVQTLNPDVGQLISRRQDAADLERNFRFLRTETGVHIHADLIVGLPGESLESFAAGFDRLYRLQPQEIQIGLLKRLRGTPLIRHDADWAMVYSPHPPYEILSNRLLSFPELQRLRRFARYWDLIGNSGRFLQTLRLIVSEESSPFQQLLALSDWLFETEKRKHAISLTRLFELMFEFLVQIRGVPERSAAAALSDDYQRGGRRDRPDFLRQRDPPGSPAAVPRQSGGRSVRRQTRHRNPDS